VAICKSQRLGMNLPNGKCYREFLSLRFSCRWKIPRSYAGSYLRCHTTGWPDDGRANILRGARKPSPRLRRMSANDSRAQARPPTVQNSRPLSDLPVEYRTRKTPRNFRPLSPDLAASYLDFRQGGRTSGGREGRLACGELVEPGVEPCSKDICTHPPKAGTGLLAEPQNVRPTVSRPAGSVRIGGGFSHTSRPFLVGTRIITI
jgi:hypothetical protein